MILTPLSVSLESDFACWSPVRTWADAGISGFTALASCASETPFFGARKIESN